MEVWNTISKVIGENTGWIGPDRPLWDTKEGRISITYNGAYDSGEIVRIKGLNPGLLSQVPGLEDLNWDYTPR